MSATVDTPTLVQAIYSFKGKNNDELCFKKGDIITLTQKEEGGWWEGTLGEKTGWFPSNYVKEYKPQDAGSPTTSKMSPSKLPPEIVAQQKAYRNLVLKDLIDSEKANVAELQGLLKNFLHPLEKSEILTKEEYRQLVGNIGCVVETHQQLLAALEECSERPPSEQRVGRVFLSSAPRVKQVHQSYCTSHPRAVCILDKYKDNLNVFMETQGAASPGLLVLTTGLSKPFRRLEKYAGMLQELERHVEENHPDRGDTQRSVSVYKDIASACSATRRQKELELEVLTGGVRGWEGEDLSCLGDILHMGSVAVGPDHRDRYLVLFPSTLLILSVSQRMSAFIYEGKLPLTAITVNKVDDTDTIKNAFEISGPMIERIVAVCQTREDQQMWMEQLRQQIRTLKKSSSVSSPPPVSPPVSKPTPLPSPHVSAFLSPYAHLAAHFSELVQKGIITRKILKKLLYSVFTDGVSLTGIRLRRKHRSECVIIPRKVSIATSTAHLTWVTSNSSSAESSGTSDTASSRGWQSGLLVRQDAVDCTSEEEPISTLSCASGPCGLICFYDSGSFDESPIVQKSVSVFGELPSKSIENIEDNNSSKAEKKKSRYRSGTTIHLEQRNPLLLGAGEQSTESSSFERTSAHKSFPCAICEDLSNLNEDVPMLRKKTSNVNSNDDRRSLPAPRRCCSSLQLSLRSLPSHVSTQEIVLETPPGNVSSSSNSAPNTHSSTFDLPVFMPVPTAMMAELLYNPDSQVIGNEECPKNKSFSGRVDSTAIGNKHMSQQKISEIKQPRNRPKRGRKMRNVPQENSFPLQTTFSHSSSCCRHSLSNVSIDSTVNRVDSNCLLCRGDIPCSSRSSDSGLADIAGNSILPSPELSTIHPCIQRSESCPRTIVFDLPHSLTLRESSEVDESNFEAQCICSSPFGSTPRTSAQPSLTSRKVFVGSSDSATQSVTSLCLSPSPVSMSQSQSPDLVMSEGDDTVGTFRSGMYAHWWLKARLPASAVRAPREGSVCSSQSCFSCTEECCCGHSCVTTCQCSSCQLFRQSASSHDAPC